MQYVMGTAFADRDTFKLNESAKRAMEIVDYVAQWDDPSMMESRSDEW